MAYKKYILGVLGTLIIGIFMFGLVAGAGYNLVVPSSGDSSSSGGGGGGGGGGAGDSGAVYLLSAQKFIDGYSKNLAGNDSFRFVRGDLYHNVVVEAITNTTARISVQSEIQYATLNVGDARRFEINGDAFYDVMMTLNSINESTSKANLTIIENNEEVTRKTEAEEQFKEDSASTTYVDEGGPQIPPKEKGFFDEWTWVYYVVLGVVLIGIIFAIGFLIKRHLKK
ncbi:hypothetical protein HOG16_01415 [Candidatus Woesearchaeota archaeon]|nr:hypothetical protein [Candidatus Woesearchaeota archaeon]